MARETASTGARTEHPPAAWKAATTRAARSWATKKPAAKQVAGNSKATDEGPEKQRSAGVVVIAIQRAKARARREIDCDWGRRNPAVARTLDRNQFHQVLSCPR